MLLMETMDNDPFNRWIELEQGLEWSTTPIAGPGSRMKMDNHIHLHTKDFPFVWTVHSIRS